MRTTVSLLAVAVALALAPATARADCWVCIYTPDATCYGVGYSETGQKACRVWPRYAPRWAALPYLSDGTGPIGHDARCILPPDCRAQRCSQGPHRHGPQARDTRLQQPEARHVLHGLGR